MMIVVEPVLKVSTVVVKIRRASLRQICQQEAGSPGGKRRAATSIGNDLPYPVGTAPNRCCRSSGSVAAQIRSALIKRGVNNQSDMLLEPESRATLMGGQDGQLSAEHICPSQFVSSSRSPPFSPMCRDLKLAGSSASDNPWNNLFVYMEGRRSGGFHSYDSI